LNAINNYIVKWSRIKSPITVIESDQRTHTQDVIR